jgi:hypothetical protein
MSGVCLYNWQHIGRKGMPLDQELRRRDALQATAVLFAALGGTVMGKTAQAQTATKGIITGKGIGDFDFLAGEWKIANRRLKDSTTNVWETFEGSATVYKVLGGMGSIEELRGRDGKYLGMGVRMWHPQEKMWADHWTGYYNGVVNAPQMGQFIDGMGVFISEERVDGVAWKYRGLWDRITKESCRWTQASSKDGGMSWDYNWFMDWTRV